MPASMHPVFSHPQDHTAPLWRYMDFTKFVSMLDHGGLYLCRADLLGDPFEGSVPKGTHEAFRRKMEQLDFGLRNPVLERSQLRRNFRRVLYLSCWHMSPGESAAMWSLYSKSDEAIAIQTTFSSLFNCVDSEETTNCYYVGLVSYIDYDTAHIEPNNSFVPFLYKRRSYEHEHEVRLVHVNPTSITELNDNLDTPEGVWVTVDLARLIHAVYVSPASQEWFRELVERVTRQFGHSHKVLRSNLATEPMF